MRVLLSVRKLWVLSVMVLLAACATPPQTPTFDATFTRSGRFVVQVRGPDEQQAVQGGFDWRANAQRWQLDLRSPLGAVLARLDATPTGVVLLRPGQMPRTAPGASELVADIFSARVPVDAMAHWIEGRVTGAQGVDVVQRDSQGRVITLQQDGWRVSFDRYDQRGPRLLEVSGQDEGRDVMIRMVVDGS